MSKTRRFWLGIAFSAAFSTFMLYLVIHDVDWQAAFAAIAKIDLAAVLAAMLLIGLGLVARGFRWLYLLCHRLGISRSISLTFIAFLINNLLPFRAGDLARIELAARGDPSVARATSLSVAVVERLLDLITVALLFSLAFSGLSSVPRDFQKIVPLISILAVLSIGILVSVATVFQERVLGWVEAFQQRYTAVAKLELRHSMESLLRGLSVVRTPKYLILALFWNAVAWTMLIVGYRVILDAMLIPANWSETILLVVAVALAITIPTTIASIGIIEGGAVLALTSQGYAYESAFVVGLILHMVTLGAYTIQGLWGMWSETLRFSTVKNISMIDVRPDT